MYLDVLDHLCLRIHWYLYTIPTFILLLATGWFFGVILQRVFMSFDFKKGQLESLLGQDQGTPVEDCLRNWRYYHYSPSLYALFCYSLWTIRIFSMSIQKYMVSILGKILTFINLKLTYHCIRKGLTILALKFLIVSPPT